MAKKVTTAPPKAKKTPPKNQVKKAPPKTNKKTVGKPKSKGKSPKSAVPAPRVMRPPLPSMPSSPQGGLSMDPQNLEAMLTMMQGGGSPLTGGGIPPQMPFTQYMNNL